MIFRSAPFRKSHTLLALTLFAGLAYADPDATAIFEAARVNPLGQKIALNAQLRTGSAATPFQIVVDGNGSVRYIFQDPEQEIILALKDDASVLSERKGGKQSPVRLARFDDPVRNSGLTYEDLSLQFLYWKYPKLLGSETVNTRKAWKIEVQAGRASSQYGVARLWIDQESGALIRMEGYNRDGKLIRRFEVNSVQKLDGQWMLKQMRIETLNPDTQKTTNRTYLEVLSKAQ